ncbi:MAG: hypothetical protein KDB61_16970, partial [Planctomycetes bacterium]|nr:hypothetical protein [Planctomycetota bacterium]
MASTQNEEDDDRKRFLDLLEVSPEKAAGFLAESHSADSAAWLADLDEEEAWRVFSILEAEDQAEILEYANDTLTAELVGQMSSPDLRDVVEEMPSDEAADILAEAD